MWECFEFEGKSRTPVKLLLSKLRYSSFVLLSNNQVGISPVILLWLRSTILKSYWLGRKLGNTQLGQLRVQLDNRRIFNWNRGNDHIGFSVSTFKYLLLLARSKTTSLEWLNSEPKWIEPSKWLSEREMYSSDFRLEKRDEGIVPLKSFSDRSSKRRDVRLLRHAGRLPSNPLRLRSNASRLSLHRPVKVKHVIYNYN